MKNYNLVAKAVTPSGRVFLLLLVPCAGLWSTRVYGYSALAHMNTLNPQSIHESSSSKDKELAIADGIRRFRDWAEDGGFEVVVNGRVCEEESQANS